jgi:SAM-dependent methyltransferase
MMVVVDWVADFYTKQYEWAGWPARWASRDALEAASMATTHADGVARLAGPEPRRILELGAGSGFTAAALAAAGHEVVAVDLVNASVQSIRRLAVQVGHGSLTAVAGDFYSVDLDGSFDVVCYFDGFGIGLTQSLRCYAPADLRLLLQGTGLTLVAIEPYEDQTYGARASLSEAMLYLSKLESGLADGTP